jgi:hypothetical protein
MAVDYYYESSFLSMQRELKQALAQRDDYRVKLNGASSDQAASKIRFKCHL